ncbi:MAG: response regulator [Alphaproteobacteria bacterium]|nr:response regulator [Alphaproteobacteria bacterium]
MTASAPPRLLVLDDEEALAFVLSRIAQRGGWAVETGATVAEFQAQFHAARPDLIMLDLRLGEVDGLEQLRFLQAQNYAGAIVLMSGDVDSVLREAGELGRSLGLAVVGTLSKPATNNEIRELLAPLFRSCRG